MFYLTFYTSKTFHSDIRVDTEAMARRIAEALVDQEGSDINSVVIYKKGWSEAIGYYGACSGWGD